MNEELEKIKKWLDEQHKQQFKPKSIAKLSASRGKNGKKGVPLVDDKKTESYDFDAITAFFFPNPQRRPCSCDALLLKDHLYFIEFKRMGNDVDIFNKSFANISNKKKKQSWHFICSVESKLSESLRVLEKKILPLAKADAEQFEKHAIIVINSNEKVRSGLNASYASAAGQNQEMKIKKYLRFQVKNKDGTPFFYHNVKVIPDNLFAKELKSINKREKLNYYRQHNNEKIQNHPSKSKMVSLEN